MIGASSASGHNVIALDKYFGRHSILRGFTSPVAHVTAQSASCSNISPTTARDTFWVLSREHDRIRTERSIVDVQHHAIFTRKRANSHK